MSIQSEIYSTHRFLRRAKKFIEKVNESLNCEICYTHRKATTYTCTHKVCQTCYEKTKQCPFCRAPKPLILTRLYLSEGWIIWKMGQSNRSHATEWYRT
jgi:RNase H-fold protein (predicted Holliday junction resolvase)